MEIKSTDIKDHQQYCYTQCQVSCNKQTKHMFVNTEDKTQITLACCECVLKKTKYTFNKNDMTIISAMMDLLSQKCLPLHCSEEIIKYVNNKPGFYTKINLYQISSFLEKVIKYDETIRTRDSLRKD